MRFSRNPAAGIFVGQHLPLPLKASYRLLDFSDAENPQQILNFTMLGMQSKPPLHATVIESQNIRFL